MGEKIWLKSYPANLPAEIVLPPFSSLSELLEDTFRRFAAQPAFDNLGHGMSPDMDPAHVAVLVEAVHRLSAR